MKLIIDIPEQMYINAKADTLCGADTLVNAIKNGIPLPKGHGRLIDADTLVDGFEDNYEFCKELNATPTIIEAESEE